MDFWKNVAHKNAVEIIKSPKAGIFYYFLEQHGFWCTCTTFTVFSAKKPCFSEDLLDISGLSVFYVPAIELIGKGFTVE